MAVNETLNLIKNRLFYAAIGVCMSICLSGASVYYGIRAELAQDRADMKVRQMQVDGKFENIDTRLEHLEVRRITVRDSTLAFN